MLAGEGHLVRQLQEATKLHTTLDAVDHVCVELQLGLGLGGGEGIAVQVCTCTLYIGVVVYST